MAKYRVTSPEGSTYEVTGPDGASNEEVLSQVKAYSGAGATPAGGGGAGAPAAPAAPQGGLGGTPAGAATGRTQVPAAIPPTNRDSDIEFTAGNLNKGIANIAGLPVDTLINVANLGRAGVGTVQGAMGGNMPDLLDPSRYVGSSAYLQNLMRRGNVITPASDPQSAGGRYLASALQMAPGAMAGRPTLAQAPRAVGAAMTSGIGAEAARDIGGDEWAAVGAMLPGAGRMQNKSPGVRATEARQSEAFGKAREMGIPVPPSALKADKAQQAVQNVGNKELRQPEGTEFTPKTLQAYRNAHYGDYEAVMKSPALAKGVQFTPTFQQKIQTIGNEIEAARTTLPETFKNMRPALRLLSEYGYAQMPKGVQAGKISAPPRAQPMPPDVAMRAVKKLRNDASTNFSSDKPEKVELARVQKRLANSIEDMIEENLARTGDQGLVGKWKEARTAIAKSHDYEAAMEPGGKINAAKLAAMQNEGAPLSGGTQDIAQVAGAFPSAVSKPKDDTMFTQRVSPMAVTHPPAVAAHQVPRFWEKAMMNPAGQAYLDPRGRLTPEQQRMLRAIAASTASNQGIPTPPEQRQDGGPVQAGQPYVVGEQGPEVVVPKQPGQVIPNPSTMSWVDTIGLRNQFPDYQQMLAPIEHQAYVREETAMNPMSGILHGAVFEPGYQLMKALGLMGGRSSASMDQVFASLEGIPQGLRKRYQ